MYSDTNIVNIGMGTALEVKYGGCPKPSGGSVLKCLNKCVQREIHLLSYVKHSLAQLTGAQVFTMLDANGGYWQISLPVYHVC